MPRSLRRHRRQFLFARSELSQRNLHQLGDAQARRCLHAFAMALRIETIDQRVFGVRVEDPEMRSRRQRHGVEGRPATVDEHQMTLSPKTGYALVKNAAGHADKMILRVPRHFHQHLPGRTLSSARNEDQRRRQLDRCAATQPRAHRQVGHCKIIKSPRGPQAELRQRRDNAQRIIRPARRFGKPLGRSDRNRDEPRPLIARKAPLIILPSRQRHPHAPINRRAEHDATVIIGVIPDELDPTRSAGDELGSPAKHG